MRPRAWSSPGWLRGFGTVLIVGLPIAVAANVQRYLHGRTSLVDYVIIFLFVALGAQAGLMVRRWGNMSLWRFLLDLVLSAILGAVSYGVVEMAVRQGGGPVDPSLVAVFMAYLLAIWSGQNR
ncbi:MAG: hypothetical protein M0Z36_00330 [Thermaerobacter sp.]|nr:hypothetical protein [Thermaerobacter sp.]